MNRVDLYVCYAFIGGFLLLTLHFIRARLEKGHPELFSELGSPRFQDSNMGATYWRFQKFVWWGHFSVQNDIIIHGLCILACLIEAVVVVLFFLVI